VADIDFKDSGVPEISRYEHRRKNHGVKAVLIEGYDPVTDTFLPFGVTTNPDGTSGLPTGTKNSATKIDDTTTAGVIYIGKAAVGSSAASAVWQIKKLDTNTLALDKTWADSGAFTQVWDNRASLSYS